MIRSASEQSSPDKTALMTEAEVLHRRASESGEEFITAARELVDRARVVGDHAARALAERSLGRALRAWDLTAALSATDRAMDAALLCGQNDVIDAVRIVRAGVLADVGRMEEAEVLLHHVRRRGSHDARAAALAGLGGFAVLRGDQRDAARWLDKAVSMRPGDERVLADAYMNRGLVAAMGARFDHAVADLGRARDIYSRLGLRKRSATAHFNLAWTVYTRGDYVGALRLLNEVAHAVPDDPHTAMNVCLVRAMVLLAVGLPAEAAGEAGRAAEGAWALHSTTDRTQALHLLAESQGLTGPTETALKTAALAEAAYLAQGEPLRADEVRLLIGRVLLTSGHGDPGTVRRSRALADRVARRGQVKVALGARLLAARSAVAIGDHRGATRDLSHSSPARRWPGADLRVEYWTVAASLRAAQGDGQGTLSAARRGLAVLEQYQTMLSAN